MIPFEELATFHYNNFTKFLGEKYSSTAANFQAKNKLAKLNKSQFSELATDVNDEINRRMANSADYLPFVNEFPLKRNQAREKLSTLNEKRFMDLAADVLGELTRRFPSCTPTEKTSNSIVRSDNMSITSVKKSVVDSLGRSPKKPSSSLVPIVTSTSQNVAPTSKPQIPPQNSGLNNVNMSNKFNSVNITTKNNQDGPDKHKIKEYEQKMSEYQSQITEYELKNLELEAKVYKYSQLETDYEKMKSDLDKLKISEESTKEAHKEIEAKYQSLEEQYQGLKEDYGNQEQMTLAIRIEANSLLDEIKNVTAEKDKLSVSYNELLGKNEENLEKIKSLEDENKILAQRLSVLESNGSLDLGSADSLLVLPKVSPEKKAQDARDTEKSNIAKSKEISTAEKRLSAITTDRLTKDDIPKPPQHIASDHGKQNEVESQDTRAGESPHIRMPQFLEDSLVARQKTFAYEEALQELFLNAEMEESTGILISMKEIVLACKSITENVSELEAKNPRASVMDSKADLSHALTKLMGVAKNHAAKPCSESLMSLYSFSSDLTIVLENLVNAFTLSRENGRDDQDLSFENPYLTEDYDDYYDPETQNDDTVLKVFLEEQTDVIVRSIQTLLNSMRQPGPYGDDFMEIIRGIMDVVDHVIDNCRTSMMENSNNPQIGQVFEELYTASRQLESFGSEMVGPDGQSNKQLKQKMASSSYEIAKFVKELLTFLES